MLNSVIFLGRKNCIFSKKLHILLKKNSKKLLYFENSNKNKKNYLKKINNFDYLFSFRSYQILKEYTLNKINNLAINFHPGSPEYRGIGCTNFAIYNNEKMYGATAHLIDDKIDHGQILDVEKFLIKKNYNLSDLLKKTHSTQVKQCKRIISRMCDLNFNLKNYLLKYPCEEKWSKKLYSKKNLDKFYEIDRKISKNDFYNKLRSTRIENHQPYIILHGKKFILK